MESRIRIRKQKRRQRRHTWGKHRLVELERARGTAAKVQSITDTAQPGPTVYAQAMVRDMRDRKGKDRNI